MKCTSLKVCLLLLAMYGVVNAGVVSALETKISKNEITYSELIDLLENLSFAEIIARANNATAREKFLIADYLGLYAHILVQKTDKELNISKDEILANRSVLLHESAGLGFSNAQWILSFDYETGRDGIKEDKRLAEIWRQKAFDGGFDPGQTIFSKNLESKSTYKCEVHSESFAGDSSSPKRNMMMNYDIQFSYNSMKLSYEDGSINFFECRNSVFMSDNYTSLNRSFKSCNTPNLNLRTIPEFFLFSSKKLILPFTEMNFYQSRGFPSLVSLRQGACSLEEN